MALSNLLTDQFYTLALTLDNETVTPTGDGATLTIDSNSAAGALYSYSKATAFTGSEAEIAAEIIANGVPQVPVVGTNTRTVTGQDSLTPYYAGWVQDADGLGPELVTNTSFDTDITGYISRATSTISFEGADGNPSGSLLCDITGFGGGFITALSSSVTAGTTYLVSIDIKDKTYNGGFKVRVGGADVELTPTTTTTWTTYTVAVVAVISTADFEMFRNATNTGESIFDNVSVREVI